jgi:purine-binding chemotaxis protein CheW
MVDQEHITQILRFQLDQETYGIEIHTIREILELQRITRLPQSSEYLIGVMNVRGKVVPVIDLRIKLGLPAASVTADSAIIILEHFWDGNEILMGVLVDSISGVLTIDRGEIQLPPRVGARMDVQYIQGMGRIGNDFVSILRTDGLFTRENSEPVLREDHE